MKKELLISKKYSTILLFLLTSLISIHSENYLNILEKAPKDSLAYYVEQQKQRLKTHSEYHVDSMMQAGLIVYMRSEITYARQFFEMANERHKETGNMQGLVRSNANIGTIDELSGDYVEALKRYQNSLDALAGIDELSEYQRNTTEAKIYGNIGVLYNEMKDFETAYPYLEKSIGLDKKIIAYCEDSIEIEKFQTQKKISEAGIASSYNSVAFYWENRSEKDLDSALYYYKKAHDIYVSQNSPYQYHTYANIGIVYGEKREFDKALPILESSYRDALNTHSEISLPPIYHSLAYIYTETKQYAKAQKILNEGIAYGREGHRATDEIELLHILSDLQTKQHKYKEANETKGLIMAMNDSLFTKDKNAVIAEMEIKYKTKLMAEHVKTQEAKNKKNVFTLLAIVLLIFVIGLTVDFFLWRARLREKNKRLILASKLLRTQLNPHFMFNAIGAIQAYMLEHKNKDSISYLISYSRLMRNILDASRTYQITCAKEEAIISDYLILQQLRFDNFDYTISIDELINKEDTMIPPMLLQPFIENAVEHGIGSLDAQIRGKISVSFEQTEQKKICLTVKDNGKGIDSTTTKCKERLSHSTDITRQRIKVINALKQFFITFDTHSVANEGTEIIITVNKKS